jgi:hypothetical protein
MTTLRGATFFMGCTLFFAGCAASAIVDADTGDPFESENNVDEPDGSEDSDEPTTPASKPDAGKPPTSTGKPDAGAASSAGTGSKPDAAVSKPDAAVNKPDAGQPKPGAGGPSKDAAVPSNPNDGVDCRNASECTQPCLPIGAFSCCSAMNKCGCTWAPGAYCL